MTLIHLFCIFLLVNTARSCTPTVKEHSILDKSASEKNGSHVSFLETLKNISANHCYEKCCEMNTKDHCNIANFVTKTETKDILGAEVNGSCTLISCVPISSCKFTLTDPPCYSIILNSDEEINVNNTKSELLSILNIIADNDNSTEASTVSETEMTATLDGNLSTEKVVSGSKPRKGVSHSYTTTPMNKQSITTTTNNIELVTDSTTSGKILSGSKGRKGVTTDVLPGSKISVSQIKGSMAPHKNLSGSKPRKGVNSYATLKPTTVISPSNNDSSDSSEQTESRKEDSSEKVMSDASLTHSSITEQTESREDVSTEEAMLDVSLIHSSSTFGSKKVSSKVETTVATKAMPDPTSAKIKSKSTPPMSKSAKISSSSTTAITSNDGNHTEKMKATTKMSPVASSSASGAVKHFIEGLPAEKDSNTPGSSRLVFASIFGVLLLVTVIGLFIRAFKDRWQRRHYRRMDFLIDGMYDN